MAYNRITQLAEAYWAGETSLEEEKELFRSLEQQQELSPELESLRVYGQVMQNQREQSAFDPDFDLMMMTRIQEQSVPTRLKMRVGAGFQPWMMRMAATFGLLLSLTTAWYLFQPGPVAQPVETEVFADTYEDPQEAYEQVRKALMKMSSKMNDGMKHTQMLSTFHDTQEAVMQKD